MVARELLCGCLCVQVVARELICDLVTHWLYRFESTL